MPSNGTGFLLQEAIHTMHGIPHPSRRLHRQGFTLIELMVTVVIVGLLAGVAYPSFLQQIRKSRRSEAVDWAARVLQAQERYRAGNPNYASAIATVVPEYSVSTTAPKYYTLAIASGANATSYTLNITGTGSQASDTGCSSMSMAVTNGNATYTAASCWSR